MAYNLISIFTPTYNRGYILPKLYESLKSQTSDNFEWVIVDDGSSDNTSDIVAEWQQEGIIRIRYCYQENQGKHIAINRGLDIAKGVLFFIVDSDDSLKANAVEYISRFWNENGSGKYSGILSYREFPDGKLVGKKLPQYVKQCKLRDSLSKFGSTGDKVVIYRTDVISKYRYPKFDNERFFGESYVFNQIDDQYDMLIMNERVYVFDYQPDGLSQDFRKLYRENPKGMRHSMMQAMGYQESFRSKIRILAHIGCLSLKLRDFVPYFRASHIGLCLLTMPLSALLYVKIFIKNSSDVRPYMASEDI